LCRRRYKKTKRAADDELLKGDVAQRSKEIHFDTTPHYIKNGEMRDYQIRGLNWMISLMDNGINGILADEMGKESTGFSDGKTLIGCFSLKKTRFGQNTTNSLPIGLFKTFPKQ
jgi:hypothetical protein